MINNHVDGPLVLSTPNPSYIALGTQVLRIAIFVAVGAGFTWAQNISEDQIMMIATSVIGLGTFAWSIWRTFASAKREDKIASINNASTPGGPALQPERVPV